MSKVKSYSYCFFFFGKLAPFSFITWNKIIRVFLMIFGVFTVFYCYYVRIMYGLAWKILLLYLNLWNEDSWFLVCHNAIGISYHIQCKQIMFSALHCTVRVIMQKRFLLKCVQKKKKKLKICRNQQNIHSIICVNMSMSFHFYSCDFPVLCRSEGGSSTQLFCVGMDTTGLPVHVASQNRVCWWVLSDIGHISNSTFSRCNEQSFRSIS